MTKKIPIILISFVLCNHSLFASKEIRVDISKQKLYCIENSKVVMESQISSGKNGHRTPSGQFYILEKKKKHNSNKYNNASMPNMMRLTNNGVAIHAGNTARAYASHGCVRLPHSVSLMVFNWATVGTPVRIYGARPNTVQKLKEVKKRVTTRRYIANKKRHYDNNISNATKYEYKNQSQDLAQNNSVKYEYKEQSQAFIEPVIYQSR